MSTWDDLSERDKAISLYSDLYKDLNGFRPRGRWMLTCPLAELDAAVERVSADLEREMFEEDAERAFAEA
jgi:hypothetical protein